MGSAASESFDSVAYLYDETRHLAPGQMDSITQALHAELSAYDRVLEVGVGTGMFAVPLQERGSQVVGVDISHPMLAQGLKKGLRNGLMADVLRMPFRDDSMDVAYGVHLLQFIQDWTGALREIARVTQDAYYTIITDSEGVPPSLYWGAIRGGMQRVFEMMDSRNGLLSGTVHAARNSYYEVANFRSAHQSPSSLYWHYVGKEASVPETLGIPEDELRSVLRPSKTVPLGSFEIRRRTSDAIAALRARAWSPQWRVPEHVHQRAMEAVDRASFEETTTMTSRTELLRWEVKDLTEFALESKSEHAHVQGQDVKSSAESA